MTDAGAQISKENKKPCFHPPPLLSRKRPSINKSKTKIKNNIGIINERTTKIIFADKDSKKIIHKIIDMENKRVSTGACIKFYEQIL